MPCNMLPVQLISRWAFAILMMCSLVLQVSAIDTASSQVSPRSGHSPLDVTAMVNAAVKAVGLSGLKNGNGQKDDYTVVVQMNHGKKQQPRAQPKHGEDEDDDHHGSNGSKGSDGKGNAGDNGTSNGDNKGDQTGSGAGVGSSGKDKGRKVDRSSIVLMGNDVGSTQDAGSNVVKHTRPITRPLPLAMGPAVIAQQQAQQSSSQQQQQQQQQQQSSQQQQVLVPNALNNMSQKSSDSNQQQQQQQQQQQAAGNQNSSGNVQAASLIAKPAAPIGSNGASDPNNRLLVNNDSSNNNNNNNNNNNVLSPSTNILQQQQQQQQQASPSRSVSASGNSSRSVLHTEMVIVVDPPGVNGMGDMESGAHSVRYLNSNVLITLTSALTIIGIVAVI